MYSLNGLYTLVKAFESSSFFGGFGFWSDLLLRIYFRDYELNFVCKDLCYDDLVDCALICGDDTICLADCARIEAECIEGDSIGFKLG